MIEHLLSLPWEYQIVVVLQTAFTIWMLVDAYRRGAEPFWFYVIFFLQLIGALAYFFAVKINDFTRRSSASGFFQNWIGRMTRTSLDELRFRAQHSPTFVNQLALAERLMEKCEYAEAIPFLQAALEREALHGQVLYDLAKCHIEIGQPQEAIPHLQKILTKDKHWSNYLAWILLVEAKEKSGDAAGALATARDLSQLTHTMQHRCMYAEQLLANGMKADAAKRLDEWLTEYRYASAEIRRRGRKWAGRARGLQKLAHQPG